MVYKAFSFHFGGNGSHWLGNKSGFNLHLNTKTISFLFTFFLHFFFFAMSVKKELKLFNESKVGLHNSAKDLWDDH